MSKKKVVLIHSNAQALNIRGFKEIEAQRGLYDFIFLGWNRKQESSESFKTPTNSTKQLFNLKAPYGKLFLIFIPIWWIYIFIWLLTNKWDMVHVMNLDSALPALMAAKLKGNKTIYEILDTYEDTIILHDTIRNSLVRFDKYLIKHFNAIILVDEEQINELGGIKHKNIRVIYDSPPDWPLNPCTNKSAYFTLFYAGAIHTDRKLNIDKLIKVILRMEGVRLVLAGYGEETLLEEFKQLERNYPDRFVFLGKISYKEVLDRSNCVDLLFQLRDSTLKVNKYICGSTLFNSMLVGKPIIVNKDTSTAYKVMKANCGLVVNANNLDEIEIAINEIKDNPSLREELSKNARKAYEGKYSWNKMEELLQNLYNHLLQ